MPSQQEQTPAALYSPSSTLLFHASIASSAVGLFSVRMPLVGHRKE
jgi:hypothetical protein